MNKNTKNLVYGAVLVFAAYYVYKMMQARKG